MLSAGIGTQVWTCWACGAFGAGFVLSGRMRELWVFLKLQVQHIKGKRYMYNANFILCGKKKGSQFSALDGSILQMGNNAWILVGMNGFGYTS